MSSQKRRRLIVLDSSSEEETESSTDDDNENSDNDPGVDHDVYAPRCCSRTFASALRQFIAECDRVVASQNQENELGTSCPHLRTLHQLRSWLVSFGNSSSTTTHRARTMRFINDDALANGARELAGTRGIDALAWLRYFSSSSERGGTGNTLLDPVVVPAFDALLHRRQMGGGLRNKYPLLALDPSRERRLARALLLPTTTIEFFDDDDDDSNEFDAQKERLAAFGYEEYPCFSDSSVQQRLRDGDDELEKLFAGLMCDACQCWVDYHSMTGRLSSINAVMYIDRRTSGDDAHEFARAHEKNGAMTANAPRRHYALQLCRRCARSLESLQELIEAVVEWSSLPSLGDDIALVDAMRASRIGAAHIASLAEDVQATLRTRMTIT